MCTATRGRTEGRIIGMNDMDEIGMQADPQPVTGRRTGWVLGDVSPFMGEYGGILCLVVVV